MKPIKLTFVLASLLLSACGADSKVEETDTVPTEAVIEVPVDNTEPAIITNVSTDLTVPTRVTIETSGITSTLSWKPVVGATGYQVNYFEGDDGDAIVFQSASTRFTHDGYEQSVNNYTVQAVFNDVASEVSMTATADFTTEKLIISDSGQYLGGN